MNAAFASRCSLLALVVLASIGADPYRPVPKFEGKAIPDPPRQREPWTPPPTKLPRFLVAATAALFDQGMADPRGCAYREVEVGDGTILKTRGFVLPERAGEAGRFVVSWDGVVYPALSVGAAVDLDKDVRTLAESMKRDREAAATQPTKRFGIASDFTFVHSHGGAWNWGGPSGPDGRTPLKLCLLLRLGRADLAERLFAAGTTWTPEIRGRDLTDYHISYLTLATDWAAAVFIRLVTAHVQGDDAIALDAARRLSAFKASAETKAAEMGFQRGQGGVRINNEVPGYLPFLRNLPGLLADQERRAKEPAHGPIPKRGGDPSARIAALIRDLDQIDERQMMSPGAANPGNSPLVRALIAEGDPAVEPLLAALETDRRLTRSVTRGRGMSADRTVHPVYDAVLAALDGILKSGEFRDRSRRPREDDLAGRKAFAQAIRAFWMKNRAIPITDRWYDMLRDDSAGRDRWLEAAGGIVQSGDDNRPPGFSVFMAATQARQPNPPPMKGEVLRSRRDPSVSELLARRVADIARAGNPSSIPDIELIRACELALVLGRWDQKAALPVLRGLMAQCREGIDLRRKQGTQAEQYLARFMAQFTTIRAGAGDREALDEYAAWIRNAVPKELEQQNISCFEPMWTHPDDPPIAEAARWLFNDPQSPWVPMLLARETRMMGFLFHNGGIYTSPLMRVAGFRDGLIVAMADKAEIGTLRRGDRRSIQYKMNDGGMGSFGSVNPDLEAVKTGVDLPFRACDYIAWRVSSLEGAPECELYWPEDRRDRAVAATTAYLKRFGDRFTANPPRGEHDFPERKAHLAFPALDRPATPDDVRDGRAIFSLQGQGEVRVAKLADLPIKAKWVTNKDFPVDRQRGDGTIFREYEQEGWIWQAEEVRKGDRWERSYGFVGKHVIVRVPGAEIELDPGRFTRVWSPLPSGLDAMIEPVEPPRSGYEPGRPIVMALRLRNRRGVDNTAPTEFLRRGDGDRPALRRGVTLAVFHRSPNPSRTGQIQGQGGPEEELKPRRTDRFEPGGAARPLAPFEVFEAMRLDLNDWFDLTRLGSYRVRITFAADSGVGEWTANDRYFLVGDLADPGP